MIPRFANSAMIRVRPRLLSKGAGAGHVDLRVRYGILQHPTRGTVLIDTGYGAQMTAKGASLPLRIYNRLMGARIAPPIAMHAALAACGTSKDAVTEIIVTHLHADHVSELRAFPNARLHLSGRALSAMKRAGRWANLRHGIFPELVPEDVAARMVDLDACPQVPAPLGLGTGGDLFGDGSVLVIDLPGHAPGHVGLCFPKADPPLLYATDVQWLVAAAVDPAKVTLAAKLVATDAEAALASTGKVARFAAAGGQVMTCHDPALTAYDVVEVAG